MGKRTAGVDAAVAVRHGRQRRSHAWLTVLKWAASSLAVVLVATASVAAFALTQLTTEVSAHAVDISNGDPKRTIAPAPVIGAVDGGFNLLLVGVDNDPEQGDSFGERDATLNDVNILVHVPADHSSAVVVSFPRDLIVPHPRCQDPTTGETFGAMSAQPLNAAFARGGLGCVLATIENLTGLSIGYAGYVTFNGVISMTDAIGGVPVCVTQDIDDPDADLRLTAGVNVVSGRNALAFLRSRHGVGDGSDLARIASQQSYMSSLVRTARSANTLGNITRLYSLARAAATSIHLSSNLASLDSLVALALTMKDVDLDRVVFVQYPGTTGDPDWPNKVVPIKSRADQLFAAIAADQPFALGADSLRRGVTVDPNQPVDAGGTPSATDAAPAEVIDGVIGQTANTSTCIEGYSG